MSNLNFEASLWAKEILNTGTSYTSENNFISKQDLRIDNYPKFII